MGKAKYFSALSGILLIAGVISIFLEGGLRYGIDFKGGTNVDVRFARKPNTDEIRSALRTQGLGNSEIQTISSSGGGSANEVLVFVEQSKTGEQAEDSSKDQVLRALNTVYGPKDASKPDFNTTTPGTPSTACSSRQPCCRPAMTSNNGARRASPFYFVRRVSPSARSAHGGSCAVSPARTTTSASAAE